MKTSLLKERQGSFRERTSFGNYGPNDFVVTHMVCIADQHHVVHSERDSAMMFAERCDVSEVSFA